MHDHLQFVVLTFDDETLGVMQFLLTPRVSVDTQLEGFDHTTGIRTASDAAIQREVDLSSFDKPVISWRRIRFEDLPADTTFRAAWRDSGQHVYHDMPTCREIHKNRIRKARAPLLLQLDVEYQRAIEENNTKYRNEVVKKKRQLRDVTDDPRIDAAQSPDELKAVWPLDDE